MQTAIRTTVRKGVDLPFSAIASKILPSTYDLSIVLCGDALATRMNKEYRKKTYSPNVLSFEYDKNAGEIFLNVRKAEREARAIGTTTRKRAALLLVHGCFHLKGLSHGRTMEQREEQVLRSFGLW